MTQSGAQWGLARVHGESMQPTLQPGDLLLVKHGATPVEGEMVVVRLPDHTIAIKRAAFRHGEGWWVSRDNPNRGIDSANVGEIAVHNVLAVAKARVWPRPGLVRRRVDPAEA